MPSSCVHLGLEERRRIHHLREAKVPVAEIAAVLGRHRPTIHREIARNWWHDVEVPQAEGYWPLTAQDLAVRRRRAMAKLERHAELRDAVVDRLRAGWSPEQIAGRLRVEPAARQRLCHETIYRFVYSSRGRSEELARYLPERRRRRRPRLARKPRGAVFPEHAAIRHRPEAVGQRAEFGHWEADLMIFRKEHGLANVTTLVERRSRYIVLLRNNDRQSKPIVNKLIEALAPLPAEARRSVHLRSRVGVRSLARARARPRRSGVVLRSPGALAEGHGGEHQPPGAALAAPGHRRAVGPGSGHRRPARPPQRHAPQVPRMAHPRRGVPRPPHGAATVPPDTLPRPAVAPRLELIRGVFLFETLRPRVAAPGRDPPAPGVIGTGAPDASPSAIFQARSPTATVRASLHGRGSPEPPGLLPEEAGLEARPLPGAQPEEVAIVTIHTPTIRTSLASAPALDELAARAVRVGREAATAAHECAAGSTTGQWRRVEACLGGLGERRPFAEMEEDALDAIQGIVSRDLENEGAGTERRVVDHDHDEDGNVYAVWAEVPAHTERGHKLLEVQRLLREFAALRDEVLDRLAAEQAVRRLRQA